VGQSKKSWQTKECSDRYEMLMDADSCTAYKAYAASGSVESL